MNEPKILQPAEVIAIIEANKDLYRFGRNIPFFTDGEGKICYCVIGMLTAIYIPEPRLSELMQESDTFSCLTALRKEANLDIGYTVVVGESHMNSFRDELFRLNDRSSSWDDLIEKIKGVHIPAVPRIP